MNFETTKNPLLQSRIQIEQMLYKNVLYQVIN